VKNQGDAFFEDEIKLTNLSRRPYQDLMDRVAANLKQPPAN